jgi:hypothetical protein
LTHPSTPSPPGKLTKSEDLLHEVTLDMEPEDGVLWIYGVGGEEVLAFAV